MNKKKDSPVITNMHPPETQPVVYWYQAFMDARNHLLLVSKMVIDGNTSAALQFALQSQGILERAVEIEGRGW